MRVLNLHHVWGRRKYVAGMKSIGRGSFSTVYESAPDSDTVVKITVDRFNYAWSADYVWKRMRQEHEHHFPNGELLDILHAGGELAAHVVKVERLSKRLTPEARRLIRRWAEDYMWFRTHRANGLPAMEQSIEFCRWKAENENDPYHEVWGLVGDFISTFGGGVLDLHCGNFMMRGDTLVFNDVIYDWATYRKYSNRAANRRWH